MMGERLQATTLLWKIRHTSLPPKLQAVEHHIDSIAALVGGDSGTTPNICPKLCFKHFNLEVLWVFGEQNPAFKKPFISFSNSSPQVGSLEYAINWGSTNKDATNHMSDDRGTIAR